METVMETHAFDIKNLFNNSITKTLNAIFVESDAMKTINTVNVTICVSYVNDDGDTVFREKSFDMISFAKQYCEIPAQFLCLLPMDIRKACLCIIKLKYKEK